MSASIHDKLNRVRKPRVHITYEVETEGAQVMRELPFVVGVMGDFSGDPTQPLRPLAERKFIQIDRDNFNEVMARMTPELNLKVDNKLADDGTEMAVNLEFNAMEDFEPARVAAQVPALQALIETRDKLRDLMSKVDRSEELEALLEQVLKNEDELKSLSGQLGLPDKGGLTHGRRKIARRPPGGDHPEGVSLLDQVVAATKQTEPDRAQELVKTLVEQALTGTVTFDRNLTPHDRPAIAAIDRKLSSSSTRSCMHPRFLKLEGTLARAAPSGDEQRDRHQPEDPGAERHQARPDARSDQARWSSIRASCSRRSTRTSSARRAANRTVP